MPRKRHTARPFAGAFAVLWIGVAAFAIFGAVGWLTLLWEVSPLIAVLVAATFGTAPLIAAAQTGPAMRGGLTAWVCVLIFTAMDAAGNVNAFWEFERLATAKENALLTQGHTAALASAQVTLGTAQGKLDALPTASAVCQGLGPVNCKERKDGLASDAERLTKERDRAHDALAAIKAPVLVTLLPREVSATIFAAAALAILAGFLGTHHARNKVEKKSAQVKGKRPARKAKPQRSPEPTPPAPATVAEIFDPQLPLPFLRIVK